MSRWPGLSTFLRSRARNPVGPAAESAGGLLAHVIERAKADPAFAETQRRFASLQMETWLTDAEKALLFGVGAFAPGSGSIVEIGSYHGGSACFLAAGLARRGTGKLVCVDPHLGGPPWHGVALSERTLDLFRKNVGACGVAERIETRLGDSAAVAAVWPAEPIDAVFIDADHSFLGVLRDFECWAPKLRRGGLVLFDDADDPAQPGVLEAVRFVRDLPSASHLGTVDGVAVFRVRSDSWELIEDVRRVNAARGIRRGWDMSHLHQVTLPPAYARSRTWTEVELDTAYKFGFFARCGPGAYGYTPATRESDRRVLHALSRDRADGDVIELTGDPPRGKCRVLLCRPEEAKAYAARLLPGGVLLARHPHPVDQETALRAHLGLLAAGLEGCAWRWDLHWGVWQPHHLSSEAVLYYAAGPVGA